MGQKTGGTLGAWTRWSSAPIVTLRASGDGLEARIYERTDEGTRLAVELQGSAPWVSARLAALGLALPTLDDRRLGGLDKTNRRPLSEHRSLARGEPDQRGLGGVGELEQGVDAQPA